MAGDDNPASKAAVAVRRCSDGAAASDARPQPGIDSPTANGANGANGGARGRVVILPVSPAAVQRVSAQPSSAHPASMMETVPGSEATGASSPCAAAGAQQQGPAGGAPASPRDAEILRRELRVANVIADYPYPVLCVIAVLWLVISFTTLPKLGEALAIEGGDAFDHILFKRHESHMVVEQRIMHAKLQVAFSAAQPRLRSLVRSVLTVMYVSASDDVLTEEGLAFMHGQEWPLYSDAEYVDQCMLMWVPRLPPGVAPPLAGALSASVPAWYLGGRSAGPFRAQPLCHFPSSPAWLLYNLRVAREANGTLTECTSADLARAGPLTAPACTPPPAAAEGAEQLAPGTLSGCVAVPLLRLDPGAAARVAEDGGVAPTPQQVVTMLRLWNHMTNNGEEFQRCDGGQLLPLIRQFFGKEFGSAAPLAEADLRRFRSGVVRSRMMAGNPAELRKGVDPLCHERAAEAECGAPQCSWHSIRPGVNASCEQASRIDAGEEYGKWLHRRGHIDRWNTADGPMEVMYFERSLLWEQFLEILIRDALLALASVAFVYFYIQIHTGSFFLATLGFIQVIMPFSLAWFTYYTILGIKLFFSLSTLALYIVLSIGADDIFVFFDAWREALVSGDPECTYLRGRFSWAWRRAGTAMLVTSLTTMSAFIMTMTSELRAMSTFGLIAAILVFYDFVLVMTFFAAALVVHHRFTERTVGCCCCGDLCCGGCVNFCTCTTCVDVILPTDKRLLADPMMPVGCGQAKRLEIRLPDTLDAAKRIFGGMLKEKATAVSFVRTKKADQDIVDKRVRSYRIRSVVFCLVGAVLCVVGFAMLFTTRSAKFRAFLPVVLLIVVGIMLGALGLNISNVARGLQVSYIRHDSMTWMAGTLAVFLSGEHGHAPNPDTNLGPRGLRFLPGAVLVGFWAVMVALATNLEADAASDQTLPSWHPLQRFFTLTHEKFSTDAMERVWPVTLAAGVQHHDPLDRAGTDVWDAKDRGEPRWSPATARAAADLFAEAASQQFWVDICDRVLDESVAERRRLQRTVLLQADQLCPMRGFRDWVTHGRYFDPEGAATLAADEADAVARNLSLSPLPFPVDPAAFHGLMRTFTQLSMRREARGGALPHEYFSEAVLFHNGGAGAPPTVRCLLNRFNTSLRIWNEPEKVIRTWFDAWESWLAEYNSGAAEWAGTGAWRGRVMHSSEVFVHMHSQAVIVSEAQKNVGLMILMAVSVVMLATMNPLIGVLVAFELIGVVGTVLGLVYCFGWNLGIIESISMTLIIGLSVDYVVHFAMHYTESSHETRGMRALSTVQGMGSTVLGGAATSIGASIMLVACWLQFFFKFGCFFLLTILFSYLWAMFFFIPVLSAIGPQGPRHAESFSLRPYIRRLFTCRRRAQVQPRSVEPEEVAVGPKAA